MAGKSPGGRSRSDTSLGLLTKKFVKLLRAAPDGVSYLLSYCSLVIVVLLSASCSSVQHIGGCQISFLNLV